jgi:hypothetical protein
MKKCYKCGIEKSYSYFNKNKSKKDGYSDECRDCTKEYNKEYRVKYAEKEKNRDCERRKLDIDVVKKRRMCRVKVGYALSKIRRCIIEGKEVTDKIYKPLGCTFLEIKKHFESKFEDGWTWLNYGVIWENDHIIPLTKFNMYSEEDIKKANKLDNLRPLEIVKNRRKNNE